MDISQKTTVEMHGAGPSGSGHQRRRPPKLKSVDRTVSVVVDNYTPLTASALSARNAGPLVINMDQPPPPPRRSSPNINEETFKSHSQSSNSMDSNRGISNSLETDYPPPVVLRKSSSFRRGETIDMMDLPSTTSTSLQHLRKNSSLHSNAGDEVQVVPLSRHYSVRHRPTTVYPTSSFQPVHHPHQDPASASVRNAQQNRRNCNMHRSFHDPKRVTAQAKRDAVKSNSFSSDEQQPPTTSHLMYQQQHPSMQFQSQQQSSKHSSMESELYRSRSNSRSNSQGFDEQLQYLDVWKPSPMPSPQASHMRKSASPRPTSSNSLDQVLSQGSVSPRPLATGTTAKMLRHQHTVAALNPQFLAPIPLLALDKSFDNVYQVKSPVFDMKKSYSLKYKNGPGASKENRELFKSRKSKSFISDADPLDVPFGMSPNLSPAALSASGSIKKHHSPLISPVPMRGNMLREDMKRRSGDGADLLPQNPQNFPIEFGTLDFNTIYKSYRAQQKSAGGSNRRHKHRRKKSSASLGQKDDDDFESESITKRKRIVCIVMTVFLGLVLFAVLAVIVTLTHASVSQEKNQTRHVYTFARDSRPIHYPAGGGGGGN